MAAVADTKVVEQIKNTSEIKAASTKKTSIADLQKMAAETRQEKASSAPKKEWKKVTISYPPAFKFNKPGDSIEGIFSKTKTVFPEGSRRDLMVIHTSDGARTIWMNTHLCSQVHELQDSGALFEGADIRIVLTGYQQSQRNQRYCYEVYEVYL